MYINFNTRGKCTTYSVRSLLCLLCLHSLFCLDILALASRGGYFMSVVEKATHPGLLCAFCTTGVEAREHKTWGRQEGCSTTYIPAE